MGLDAIRQKLEPARKDAKSRAKFYYSPPVTLDDVEYLLAIAEAARELVNTQNPAEPITLDGLLRPLCQALAALNQ